MFQKTEVDKARFTVISSTNMIEYAMDIYRGIYGEDKCPKGKKRKSNITFRSI
jgi:hypothetical protein